MARTEELWQTGLGGGYIEPINPNGFDILLKGSNRYLNFGSISGTSGYGIRDNAGTMQFKNLAGAWTSFGAGGGSGDVVGPVSSVNNRVVFFDGITGKLIKDSGLTLSGTNTGDQTSIVGITGTKAQFDTACTDGDFAYASDLASYVPYTGATADVLLGGNKLKALEIIASTIPEGGNDSLSIQASAGSLTLDGLSLILRGGTTFGISNDGGSHISYFDTTSQTADRTITTPDANGTIVLSVNGTAPNTSGNVIIPTGGGTSGQATVDFGAVTQEDSITTLTVATSSAVTTSKIFVTPAGVATADHDPDDYQWDNISGYVTNIVDGVSFDLVGVAPNGTWGQYVFNYVIN